ncbi:hypothetical protein HPB47_015845 [Ixodes persulcatus]|uniref:Uncharacterized protein n=1 Tax=Ixodes persulcatus TaxID=34615 RepID=A0AC60QW29_IXOPE|nr:hypothetical protein HPB47_015845 [Ixodes persulcatus]
MEVDGSSHSSETTAPREETIGDSTYSLAGKLNSIQGNEVDGRQYRVATYMVAPDDTVKGHRTSEENGQSNSVIILFQGRRVPFWVRYGCVETRCFLHQKKRERNPPHHQIPPEPRAQPCAALSSPTGDVSLEIRIEGPIQVTEQNSTSSSQAGR